MPPPRRLPQLLLFWCAVLLGAIYYAWTPAAFRQPLLTPTATDLYHEMADALLDGRLSLHRAPEPGLLALPDPYDPATNEPYRLDDLSLHDGRYYLYHSLVPAIVLFAPVKALTGHHLSQVGAVALFAAGAWAGALALLCTLRARHAPRAPFASFAVGLLAGLLAPGAHAVLRVGTLNHVPIAAAWCFGLLGLACWARGDAASGPRLRHLALAGACLGLAVASRPNLVFAAAAALATGLVALTLARRDGRVALAGRALACLAPFGLIIAALLALNYARFGAPFEFGARLMLGAWDQRTLPALAATSLGPNLHHYLFALGRYQFTFPQVVAPTWTSLGLVWHAPFVLLALAAALRPRWRNPAWIVGPALTFGAVSFLTLLLVPSGDTASAPSSANSRYLLDFQPYLLVAAVAVALLAAHAWADQARTARRWTLAVGTLAVFTAAVGFLLDLGRYPTTSVRPLAAALSRPAWSWDAWRGVAYGPVELDVEFPPDRLGAHEPLLSLGDAEAGDLLYVFYESPTTLRLGLVSVGAAGPLSAPIPVDLAARHRLRLDLGPLYPPLAHPEWRGFAPAEIASRSRRAEVRLDDEVVFTAPYQFRARSGEVVVGQNSFLPGHAAPAFTGTLHHVNRLPLPAPNTAPDAAPTFGPLRLLVRWPAVESGSEPLLSTGVPGAGDLLHVRYRADGKVQFALDHWGRRAVSGEWVAVDRARPQSIEITTGALQPPSGHAALAALPLDARRRLQREVRVTLDGEVVLAADLATYPSAPHDVAIGTNLIGSSSATYGFSGEITEAVRLPPALNP